MDLTFITELYIPLVIAGCLILGYIAKKWIRDVDNKYIPTIVCIAGGILACLVNREITVSTIIAGCISGLASTGLHQIFKQLMEDSHGI